MNETIQWPEGEFTIQDAMALNAAVAQAVMREELAAAIKVKRIVQTRKGSHRIKGKFKVVQEPTSKV